MPTDCDFNEPIWVLIKQSEAGKFMLYNVHKGTLDTLEQRKDKNDSILTKIIPVLKLPRFFPRCIGGKKERQFQKWNFR